MNDDIVVLFYKLSSAIVTRINNELRPYSLTFQQFSILNFVAQQQGEVIGKDICQYLGISHPTAVGLVTRMVGNDFLIVKVSQSDRRQTTLYLSEKGKLVLSQTESIVQNIQDEIMNVLGKNHQEILVQMEGLKNLLNI